MAKKRRWPVAHIGHAAPIAADRLGSETRAKFEQWRKLDQQARAAFDELRPLLVHDLQREIAEEAERRGGPPVDNEPESIAVREALLRLSSDAVRGLVDGMKPRYLNPKAQPLPYAQIPKLELGDIKLLVLLHVFMGARAVGAAARLPRRQALDAYRKRLSRVAQHSPIVEHGRVFDRLKADVDVFRRLQARRGPALRRGTCQTTSGLITDLMTHLQRCHALTTYTTAELYAFAGNLVAILAHPRCLCCGGHHTFATWRAVRACDAQRGVAPADRDPYVTARAFGESMIRDAPIAGAEEHHALLDLWEQAWRNFRVPAAWKARAG